MSEAFDYDPFPDPDEPAEPGSPTAEQAPNPLEVQLYPDDATGWAVRVTPGSATAKVLALVDPVRLSQAGRVDALVALDRLAGWAVALQHRVIAAMVEDPHTDAIAPKLEREWVSEDVRVALGESSIGARARMRTATDLVHRLPDTLDAL